MTWYEAVAYTRWLHAHVDRWLPAGMTLRLPTEAEWEAAAAYDGRGQRCTYPWGAAEPTLEYADFDRSMSEGPVEVGGRPAGAVACGALDMAGSVWEVMTSSYAAYPAGSSRVVDDFGREDHRDVPWRGGSWLGNGVYVRCTARVRYLPTLDFDTYRVRLVVAPKRAY